VRQHGQLYLLDVRIKPGDESFPHTHDQAILLTYISLAGGPQNGRVGVKHRLCHRGFYPQGEQCRSRAVSYHGPGARWIRSASK
jgi:hypothetical protein